MKETPQEYIKRITSQVEGQKPLEVQAVTAGKLQRLLEGAPTAQLTKPLLPTSGRSMKSWRIWPTQKSSRAFACE